MKFSTKKNMLSNTGPNSHKKTFYLKQLASVYQRLSLYYSWKHDIFNAYEDIWAYKTKFNPLSWIILLSSHYLSIYIRSAANVKQQLALPAFEY